MMVVIRQYVNNKHFINIEGDDMETALFTVSYLIEVEESLLKDSNEADIFRETIFQKLSKHHKKKVDEKHYAKWESSSLIVLNPEKMNCGKCNKCGGWTTDREKENHIKELSNGATDNGILLCDECLPKGHRWAF